VIGYFIKLLKQGKPMAITGDGEQTRDFVHVSDVARANLLAMTSGKVGKGEVINIGAGARYSINHVASLLGGAIEYIAPRIEPRDTEADISKAKEIIGWEPSISIEEGIKELKEINNI